MPDTRLSVATWNVHKCRGTRGFRPNDVAHAITRLGVEVLALQEVDRRFGRQRGTGLIHPALIAATGMHPVPISLRPNGLGWHGNAILLRNGLDAVAVERIDLPGAEPRGAVAVDVVRTGADQSTRPIRAVRFVAVHLGLLASSRRLQARAIQDGLAGMPSRPTVLLGDTNEWRPIGALRSLIGAEGHCGRAGPSFPSGLPIFGFDRIIGLGGVSVRSRHVVDDPIVATVSDHLPVSAVIEAYHEA